MEDVCTAEESKFVLGHLPVCFVALALRVASFWTAVMSSFPVFCRRSCS